MSASYRSHITVCRFCQGSVPEMPADPGKENVDVVRYLGTRLKIFNVHDRNIRRHRDGFVKVYPDEGDVDFVNAIQIDKEVSHAYLLRPDQVLQPPSDTADLRSFAYCFRPECCVANTRNRGGQ